MRAAALALALWGAPVAAAAASECGLALVLATDTSSSIDAGEYRAQMDGLAGALRTPLLRDALLSNPSVHVSATVVHWSGYRHQEQVVGWTDLTSARAVEEFARAVEKVPRRHGDQATALGKGLEFSARLLRGRRCARRMIDLTGDGVNNDGVGPYYFAERGDFAGMTINGLAIRGAMPDPAPWFEEHVARGPGAFTMAVDGYGEYAEAILEKLLREVAPRYTGR